MPVKSKRPRGPSLPIEDKPLEAYQLLSALKEPTGTQQVDYENASAALGRAIKQSKQIGLSTVRIRGQKHDIRMLLKRTANRMDELALAQRFEELTPTQSLRSSREMWGEIGSLVRDLSEDQRVIRRQDERSSLNKAVTESTGKKVSSFGELGKVIDAREAATAEAASRHSTGLWQYYSQEATKIPSNPGFGRVVVLPVLVIYKEMPSGLASSGFKMQLVSNPTNLKFDRRDRNDKTARNTTVVFKDQSVLVVNLNDPLVERRFGHLGKSTNSPQTHRDVQEIVERIKEVSGHDWSNVLSPEGRRVEGGPAQPFFLDPHHKGLAFIWLVERRILNTISTSQIRSIGFPFSTMGEGLAPMELDRPGALARHREADRNESRKHAELLASHRSGAEEVLKREQPELFTKHTEARQAYDKANTELEKLLEDRKHDTSDELTKLIQTARAERLAAKKAFDASEEAITTQRRLTASRMQRR